MVRILVLYNQPADPAAFDAYYHGTHVPLAKKIPGLKGMNLSVAPPTAIMGTAPYLVAELIFDSIPEMQAALGSPEGQATAADVPKFAHEGVTILMLESKSAM